MNQTLDTNAKTTLSHDEIYEGFEDNFDLAVEQFLKSPSKRKKHLNSGTQFIFDELVEQHYCHEEGDKKDFLYNYYNGDLFEDYKKEFNLVEENE